MVFGINTKSDISKLFHVISWAELALEFCNKMGSILVKYHIKIILLLILFRQLQEIWNNQHVSLGI